MDLVTFLTDLSMPPRMGRGTAKRTTSITLTEQEDDIIAYISQKLPTLYDKKKNEVIRHALHHFIFDLEDLVDSEWKPVLQQLKDILKQTNYLKNKEQIAELLDRKADMFNTLLDFSEFDGMLIEYDKYLDEVLQLPDWWQRVVQGMANQHPGMQQFLDRINSMGFEAISALRSVMERQR